MRRRFALSVLSGLVGLALLAGCSPKKLLVPELPPETTVFVQGPVDTVSYKVHLYWFGSDADGYVVGYELRFINPSQPADTQWVRTTRSDSVFAVYTPTGFSQPVFEVRAIDDQGLSDPTPARELFSFRNQPPTFSSFSAPGPLDTTFASVTASWSADDPDGDASKATYAVWLDGHEADPEITSSTTFTMPSAKFLQGGALLSGPRTLFVKVIDEGGVASEPRSAQWYVRAPVTGSRARLLIVDDEPGNTGAQARQDSLFVNTAVRNLPNGTFSILRLEFNQPFRSEMDLEQTLKLFDAVIWYRGTANTFQPVLTSYQDGVAHYLESGGKFLIESQRLVEGELAPGIFPESWVKKYLGSDFLYVHSTPVLIDSSAAWGILNGDDFGNPVVLRSTVFTDSLRMSVGGYGELRGFAVTDTAYVALWARTGNLSQNNQFDVPVAVTVPQAGGGRLVAITVPIRSANFYGSVPRFLAKVFAQLGLTGP